MKIVVVPPRLNSDHEALLLICVTVAVPNPCTGPGSVASTASPYRYCLPVSCFLFPGLAWPPSGQTFLLDICLHFYETQPQNKSKLRLLHLHNVVIVNLSLSGTMSSLFQVSGQRLTYTRVNTAPRSNVPVLGRPPSSCGVRHSHDLIIRHHSLHPLAYRLPKLVLRRHIYPACHEHGTTCTRPVLSMPKDPTSPSCGGGSGLVSSAGPALHETRATAHFSVPPKDLASQTLDPACHGQGSARWAWTPPLTLGRLLIIGRVEIHAGRGTWERFRRALWLQLPWPC